MKKTVKTYDNPAFAERLRTLMGNRNIRLEDIAKATGCALSTASTWRRGRLPRNPRSLETLANLLSVSVPCLVGEDAVSENAAVFSNERALTREERTKTEIFNHIHRLIAAAENEADGLIRLSEKIRRNIPLDKSQK